MSPSSAESVADEALRRFVRARADDFAAEERTELENWLAADAVHRREYQRLHDTWDALDGLAGHLPQTGDAKAAVAARFVRPARWLWAGGLAAACAAVLAFVLPGAAVQHYETRPGEHATVTLAGGIAVALDADSAMDVVTSRPIRVELRRGNIHVDVPAGTGTGLEVAVGTVRIRDIGTRFAVAATGAGGRVAVAEGLVEIRAGADTLVLGSGRRAEFVAEGILSDRLLATSDIAPWLRGQWHFEATPLAELAKEAAREQRIRVDIDDPGVAALKISGRFDMQEPERMLWAVSQVHGLKLRRLGERHFSLSRG